MSPDHPIGAPLLEARELRREFRRGRDRHVAVESVSLIVHEHETVAIVGESGAGKSTVGRMLAGIERPSAGTVLLGGTEHRLRPGVVSPVQMVFQDPRSALSSHLAVGTSIGESLRRLSRAERTTEVERLLDRVGVEPRRATDRPSAFSGGQLQRIVLARALAAHPKVLVCDEPTSALDVSVQAEIVNLLLDTQHEARFGCVLVTHDLGVARTMADHVMVLRAGIVEEHTPADAFFASPQTEYACQLLAASGRPGGQPRDGTPGRRPHRRAVVGGG